MQQPYLDILIAAFLVLSFACFVAARRSYRRDKRNWTQIDVERYQRGDKPRW